YPQFVQTYLEDLTASVDVSQPDDRVHCRAWTTAHQQHGRPHEEEGSKKPANSPLLEQLSGPSDTHDEPQGSLEETG
ncbi:Doublecortin domain-containing protein 1, partial [Lemmus lemmus]